MTERIKDLIHYIAAENTADSMDLFKDIISDKVSAALADKQIEVAQGLFGESVEEEVDLESIDLVESDQATGIKLYHKGKDDKESWSMHFSGKDAHKAAADYNKQGRKVTGHALMYGKKEGERQAWK